MIPIPAQAPQSPERYSLYNGFRDARCLHHRKYQTCQRKARSPTCPPLTRLEQRSRRSRRRQATTSLRSTRRGWYGGGCGGASRRRDAPGRPGMEGDLLRGVPQEEEGGNPVAVGECPGASRRSSESARHLATVYCRPAPSRTICFFGGPQ